MNQPSNLRLTLERGNIYGWTMYPGYSGYPYRSPIRVDSIEPLGQRTYKMMFLNMFYAVGVQHMGYTLRTLRREATYIVAEQVETGEATDRIVIIEPMSERWMDEHVPKQINSWDILFDANGAPVAPSFLRLMNTIS